MRCSSLELLNLALGSLVLELMGVCRLTYVEHRDNKASVLFSMNQDTSLINSASKTLFLALRACNSPK